MKIDKYGCDGCKKELTSHDASFVKVGDKVKHLCSECFSILDNLKIEMVKVDEDF